MQSQIFSWFQTSVVVNSFLWELYFLLGFQQQECHYHPIPFLFQFVVVSGLFPPCRKNLVLSIAWNAPRIIWPSLTSFVWYPNHHSYLSICYVRASQSVIASGRTRKTIRRCYLMLKYLSWNWISIIWSSAFPMNSFTNHLLSSSRLGCGMRLLADQMEKVREGKSFSSIWRILVFVVIVFLVSSLTCLCLVVDNNDCVVSFLIPFPRNPLNLVHKFFVFLGWNKRVGCKHALLFFGLVNCAQI